MIQGKVKGEREKAKGAGRREGKFKAESPTPVVSLEDSKAERYLTLLRDSTK
jgi:hypothetical protein